MALKIKWNDDRVKGVAVALLLIVRERLLRGETEDLIAASLADFRDDPDDYKARHPKRDLAAAKELGGLKNARHIEYFQKLIAALERFLVKVEKNRRQFNSLVELDNFLIFTLPPYE